MKLMSGQKLVVQFGHSKKVLSYFTLVSADISVRINTIPRAELELHSLDSAGSRDNDLASSRVGSEVDITIKDGSVTTTLFSGIVVNQKLKMADNKSVLQLSLRHPLIQMAATYRNRVFVQKSDEKVIRSLLADYRLAKQVNLGRSQTHEQMVQCNQSDWQFLLNRVKSNAAWLFPNNSGGVVVKRPDLKSAASPEVHSLSMKNDDFFIKDAAWQFSYGKLSQHQTVSSWDIKTQKMQQARASIAADTIWKGQAYDAADIPALTTMERTLNYTSSLSNEEIKMRADAEMLSQYASGVEVQLRLRGSAKTTKFESGDTLVLSDFDKQLNGRGVITHLRHRFVEQNWDTFVSTGAPRELTELSENSVLGNYIGIVEKSPANSDALYRLRVHIPALELTLWARFSMPYASKKSGFCFYPESGDEVVLAFFSQDPSYPVIQGAMHNPKKVPPGGLQGEKSLVLDSGQALRFDNDGFTVSLENKHEQVLLNVKGSTISSERTLTLSSKEKVTLSGKQKVTLSGKSVQVKGKNIDMSH